MKDFRLKNTYLWR